MNVKTTIQLLVFFIILIFLYFFIKSTFLKDQKNIVNLDQGENKILEDKAIEKLKVEKDETNIIENLSYISIDAEGNEYILNAKYGKESTKDSNIIILEEVVGIINLKDKSNIEINSDFAKYNSITFDTNFYENVLGFFEESKKDSNIIILEEVVGIIKLKDKSIIEIKSDFAKYNSINFDTKFYENVLGLFEESKVSSDNLDLFFKNNKAIMYNNVHYLDKKTKGNADEISFNLSNGDVNIKMFNKNKKVQISQN